MTLVALFATLALAALPSGMQDSAGALSRLPGSAGEPALAVRHGEGAGDVVLYVHGSTFPSASSVAWRVDGWSWMDDLNARGFDVWAFDFAGYGGSDRPAAMAAPPQGSPIGRAEDGALQIARVVDHIRHLRPDARISIIAHSWGTMPAGLYVTRHPAEIARLVLFGPPALRTNEPGGETPAWEDVTVERQRRSFRSGIPAGAASVIDPDVFDAWAEAWLATDPQSRDRTPPAVRVPGGPGADIDAAWSGRFPWDPGLVTAPTLIIRGEWDALATDEDVEWLKAQMVGVPGGAIDVKLGEGAHRMHLETGRQRLFDAVAAFLIDAPS